MAKRRMSKDQEFEIMKLVLDKFLWLGLAVMTYGLYKWYTTTIAEGVYPIVFGIIVLVIFIVILAREYEFSH